MNEEVRFSIPALFDRTLENDLLATAEVMRILK